MAARSNCSLIVDTLIKAKRCYAWREVRRAEFSSVRASSAAPSSYRAGWGLCLVGRALVSVL